MTSNLERLEATKIKLTIAAGTAELDTALARAVKKLGQSVRLPGFRAGKAPANLVEKAIDPATLQTEVLDDLINRLYSAAATEHKLRPATAPEVSVTKFVPFSTLEFTAEVEVVGEVKLGDYKKVKLAKPEVKIDEADIKGVLDNLNRQNAERKEVARAAKLGDEVVIDFTGRDSQTGQKINGADGKEYPLELGSNQFIPGFEEQIVGLKAGADKEFDITFPKDYGVASLQSKKVTFLVSVKKVNSVELGKIDDAWVAKSSPFKTLAELKADIKNQLTAERSRQADQQYRQDILDKITSASSVEIPKQLIDEEIERLEGDEKRSLAYRGQTYQEHLDAEGLTADQHKEQKRPTAEARVKQSLVLTEIAEAEGLNVSDAEIEARINILKTQYRDSQMRAELSAPGAKNQIGSQILTEKTFAKLVSYADTSNS